MTRSHPVQCVCGSLKGELSLGRRINRAVCYCADCQAFAHFLERANEILDDRGGTEVIQVAPGDLTFTAGIENLACVRLTPNGLMRWYAACCRTPIGNTLATPRLSFVGLVHNCLRADPRATVDDSFGPLRIRAHTKAARGSPKPTPQGVFGAVVRLAGMMISARLSGRYKDTPFFDPDTGQPVTTPKVLSEAELERIRTAVRS